MNDIVTVLDIGSTKAVCVAAELAENGQVRVLSMHSVPCSGVRRGVVADLADVSNAAAEVIRKVQIAAGLEMDPVVVATGGSHLEGMNAQGFVPIVPQSRTITRDDVLQVVNHSRQLMMTPDREQIQALPREFKVNGQRGITRPVGMSGSKLEVVTYVVTGHTPHIQNLERAVNSAGRKVESMVLSALASGLGVLSSQDLELGAAVVDIGGDSTDVAVFSGGSIAYHACLPIGGKQVTSDISKLLKTSPEEAERLKLKYGMASSIKIPEGDTIEVLQLGATETRPMQKKVFAEIVESRMRELAVMVRQHIEKSGLYAVLPGGIVLTGGGSQLPGSDELFGEVLQHLRVRLGAPKVDGQIKSSMARPEMATVVGLAKFALDRGEDEFASGTEDGSWRDRIKTMWSFLGQPKAKKGKA
ncbi:MAG: cell division protein FtsA [Fimbriimonadaceae bacterium]